jgi:predicted nucleotidyltransferase
MRLTAAEARAIKRCTAAAFGPAAVVRLFGSRVDDRARGGDIDLHVEVARDADTTTDAEARFRDLMEDAPGERKVDIVFHRRGRREQPIDRIARQTGIVL